MWLSSLLGLTVIKDRQGARRPPVPYATVDLANFRDVSEQPRDIIYDSDVLAQPDIEVEWVFLVMVYGASGADALRRVQSAVHVAQIQEPLMPALVVHEVGTVNTIPELIGERWEPRAQVNLVVRGTSRDTFSVDTIREPVINITGERA